MQTVWRIELLGCFQATQGRQTISRFATAKTAALLAYLALFPRSVHPREELVDLFWPDSDLDAGRNSLKQALASLRRQLEPPGTPSGSVLITDRMSVRLNPVMATADVAEFEAALKSAEKTTDVHRRLSLLATALELYRGELLPGFYDEWALTERERLAELSVEALGERRRLSRQVQAQSRPDEPRPAAPESGASPEANDVRRLPWQMTRFCGREPDLGRLETWLQDGQTRLITLTGTGGIGKTRLALEIARRSLPLFHSRVCFAPLADLSDAKLMPTVLLDALDLNPNAGHDPWEQITEALAGNCRTLIVLDNMEQIADAGALQVARLLAASPGLICLVTSRQRLELAGEREYPLPPLPLPGESDTPEALLSVPSVQVFVGRAQAARADFALTVRNADAVGRLCRHLEGIPLALELAAAWIQVLSPAQILTRLQERFSTLVSRRKDAPERHQRLWATVGWSYDLLLEDLQSFWSRLAVFRGGWTVESAEAVCDEPKALYLLTQLRARSLLLTEDSEDGTRFRLLDTLREFAWAQLSEAEQQETARRHADFFGSLAAQAKPGMVGPEQAVWLDRLDQESDNLRAALAWGIAHDGRAALATADSLFRFWNVRGRFAEGRQFLEAALAAAPEADVALQSSACTSAATFALDGGDAAAAWALNQQALTLAERQPDRRRVSSALFHLARVAQQTGDLAQAQALFQQSYEIDLALGDRRGSGLTLNSLGRVAFARKDYAAARAFYEQSLKIKRESGDIHAIANTLGNLGTVAHETGDFAQAAAIYRECLALQIEIEDHLGIAFTLLNLSDIAAQRQEWERAATLCGAMEAVQEGVWAALSAEESDAHRQSLDKARAALGEEAYRKAWSAGNTRTLEQAVAFALGDGLTTKADA